MADPSTAAPRPPIPLVLSDEAPQQPGDHSSCRKCGRDFIPLILRSRNCYHCGHAYCHACTENQALVRKADSEQGVERVHVCASCYDLLILTASRKSELRSQPLAKLKSYLTAYGLQIPPHAVEKDDIVDIILNARRPNGALPAEIEGFYRRNGVPRQPERRRGTGMFGRGPPPSPGAQGPNEGQARRGPPPPPPTQSRPQTQTRPQAQSQDQSRSQWQNSFPNGTPPYQPRAPPQSRRPPQPDASAQARSRPSSGPPPTRPRPQPGTAPSGQQQYRPPPGPPPSARPSNPTPQYRPPPGPPPPPTQERRPNPVIPALSELLAPDADLDHMSIGVLKGILERNHVNTHLLVEKADLVEKVRRLVEQEGRERERMARVHEMEEEEERRQREEMDEIRREERERHEREARHSAGEPAAGAEHDHGQDESGVHPGAAAEGQSVPAQEDGAASTTPSSGQETPPADKDSSSIPKAAPAPRAAQQPRPSDISSLIGLCVVCQDDEANIAIVDCGHLALCLQCSELIMETTRECPLCRTRIVTQQRLLRIYRT